jgi:hypothetical protein
VIPDDGTGYLIYLILPAGLGIDSASNRNEYQDSSRGQEAAGS